MAASYSQLGVVAQDRGRLEDADAWCHKGLTIFADLEDRPNMVSSYGLLALLAEQRGQRRQALEWIIRSIALFEQFPHPVTGPAPEDLARLTAQLSIDTLEASWLESHRQLAAPGCARLHQLQRPTGK
jgi:Tetratricopeptide repeat